MLAIAALVAVASQVSAYSLCNPNNYPFAGQKVSVPLQATATVQLTVAGMSVPVGATGNVNVVSLKPLSDGCTFSVSNFVLTGPSSLSYQWYGAIKGSNAVAEHISLTTVTNAASQTFSFVTTAGNDVSFSDFNEFHLFETTTMSLIAIADLPAAAGVGGGGNGGSSTTVPVTTSASGTGASTTTSSAVASSSATTSGASASGTPKASSASSAAGVMGAAGLVAVFAAAL